MKPMSTERLLPISKLTNTEFYNDWMRPAGKIDGNIDAASALRIAGQGGQNSWLILHYDVRDSLRQMSIIESLMSAIGPNLRRALAASRVHYSSPKGASGVDVVDAISEPAMLVDANSRILHFNRLAERIVAEKGPITIDGRGTVSTSEAHARRRLASAVRLACGPTAHHGDEIELGHDGAHRLLVIPVRSKPPSTQSLGAYFQPFALAVIVIRAGRTGAQGVAARLKEGLGLTSAETLICIQMLEGKSTADIATALGCSYETVRSHTKRIFEKTRTHRQAELALFLRDFVC